MTGDLYSGYPGYDPNAPTIKDLEGATLVVRHGGEEVRCEIGGTLS